jgi:hypothetical protein
MLYSMATDYLPKDTLTESECSTLSSRTDVVPDDATLDTALLFAT